LLIAGIEKQAEAFTHFPGCLGCMQDFKLQKGALCPFILQLP
jgi:hypothetical protein